MSIGEKLIKSLEIKTLWTIKLGGFSIPVTETVVISWAAMAILIIAAFLATRKLKEIPSGVQVITESLVDFLNTFSREQFGKQAAFFGPYVGTLFLYLLTVNIIPAFTPQAAFGREALFELKPPARDINVPAALALVSILMVIFSGLIIRGPKGWLKTFFHPVPAMLPFNILEYVIKPVTLCLRLFGNILGAFIIMTLVNLALENAIGFSAGISIIPSLYFDFLDGFIQALVFTFLTTLYISEAVQTESH
ncbi:MAG: F0F1 ATP synthase subunit A [Spirochaetaceae bacterium]|jgi:F-type H+-transporting ATPase subunit a|nr:F0F1 ATP synthase subunit A [Spirochaetaceae bacterium]GMO23546.1 MAG: F0F1 ATP synthase subunit A [Termitinemataceae bacterium]